MGRIPTTDQIRAHLATRGPAWLAGADVQLVAAPYLRILLATPP